MYVSYGPREARRRLYIVYETGIVPASLDGSQLNCLDAPTLKRAAALCDRAIARIRRELELRHEDLCGSCDDRYED